MAKPPKLSGAQREILQILANAGEPLDWDEIRRCRTNRQSPTPSLIALEGQGLVETGWAPAGQRQYSVTPAGRDALGRQPLLMDATPPRGQKARVWLHCACGARASWVSENGSAIDLAASISAEVLEWRHVHDGPFCQPCGAGTARNIRRRQEAHRSLLDHARRGGALTADEVDLLGSVRLAERNAFRPGTVTGSWRLGLPGTCRICGCSDGAACTLDDGQHCAWADAAHTLCTNPECLRQGSEG